MCLIICAFQQDKKYPLVMAANRDEFHDRPTASAGFWEEIDGPGLLAGRDLTQGGSWLGITRQGRFAAVTNMRSANPKLGRRSRGFLVSDYLRGNQSAQQFMATVQDAMYDYAGFNLLLGDQHSLLYLNNSDGEIRALTAGIYGLSNGLLDSDWPKVTRGKNLFAGLLTDTSMLTTDTLIDIMTDRQIAPDAELPDTGVPLELERLLSASFIANPSRNYGTRCSTAIIVGHDGNVRFCEQNYAPDTSVTSRKFFEFPLQA